MTETLVASGGSQICEVWSIAEKTKLYTVNHQAFMPKVCLLSDATLGFDMITASVDQSVKFWLNGYQVKCLKHAYPCWHFDFDCQKRFLVVATGKEKQGGVVVWRVEDFTKVGEQSIADTRVVRFNSDSTKITAVTADGQVFEILSDFLQ